MFKNIFKMPDTIDLIDLESFKSIELTKAQKYASLIHQCLMAGVKIPSEFISEYNKAVDIEVPKSGKVRTTSEVLYPIRPKKVPPSTGAMTPQKRPGEVLYECDPSKAITCRKVTCKYSEHRKDGITPCDATTHKEWARLDENGREIIALGDEGE